MIDDQDTVAEPVRPMSTSHRAALITAVITGLFGSVQSMQGADSTRTNERFERRKSELAETYDVLAANQNAISTAITKLSQRNNALKRRVLELERTIKRLEVGVDDDTPLLIFEQSRQPIKIQPLPTIPDLSGPPEIEH